MKAGYSDLFLMKEELQKVLDSIAEFKSFLVTVTQVQQGNGTYEREKRGRSSVTADWLQLSYGA
jgi:hypothetical protein